MPYQPKPQWSTQQRNIKSSKEIKKSDKVVRRYVQLPHFKGKPKITDIKDELKKVNRIIVALCEPKEQGEEK